MSQVVQARCPHCQNVLRIPGEWLGRSMRCKLCQKTFEAKAKAPVPIGLPASTLKALSSVPVAKPAYTADVPVASPAVAVAAAAPLAAKPASNNLFGFDQDEPAGAPPTPSEPRRRKKGSGLLLVLMFFILFLLGTGGVSYVAYNVYHLEPTKVVPRVAHGDGSKGDGTPIVPKPSEKDGTKSTDGNGNSKDKSIVSPPLVDGTKDKKKKIPPPRKDATKDAAAKDGSKKSTNDPFPRRALLISVNNYLMWSTVHYGSSRDDSRKYPGSSTSELRERLTRPPMYFPVTQVFELSDGIPPPINLKGKIEDYKGSKAHSTQKSVLETTITDFLDSSREQDRVVIFYAGHAAHVENVSYLVPIDGNKNNMDTLLPLKWVYDQMAKCKAQQKVLILDVFRFSPSRGFELPSPGEGEEGQMPEGFDKDLLSPPTGVMVWSSCIKGQSAVELDEGSAFSQALCNAMQGGGKMAGIANQTQPIQIEALVTDVNQRLKDLLIGEKRTQVSRLTGKAGSREVAFDPAQPLPGALAFKPPTAAGGDTAPVASVEKILEELRLMPPVRDTRAGDINLLRAQNLPAFTAKKIESYKTEGYQSVFELQRKFKDKATEEAFAKEFPLRAAYFEALEALDESRGVKLREILSRADADPKRKAAFLLEQEPLSRSQFKLEGVLNETFKEVAEKRDSETSKRWQANFDYVHARLLSRIVYLYEYNFTIGQIRNDNLPELMGGQSGWRVGVSGPKVNVTEPKAKKYAKEAEKLWKNIQKDYPDTPWALLAQRESMFAQGLAWKAKSD